MSYLNNLLKPENVSERRRFLREIGFPEKDLESFLQQSPKEQFEFLEEAVEALYASGGRTDAIRHLYANGYQSKRQRFGFIDNNDEA